jgi:FKBP-type peptidyl-prolyl cis-trans isomerase (trigger factor)
MTLQFQEKEYCKYNVHYVSTKEELEAAKNTAFTKLKSELVKQKVKVPGFRVQKATKQAIVTHFKPSFENFIKQELFDKAYKDFQFQFDGKPMFSPKVNSDNLHGSEYWCDFDVYIKPKVTLNKYKEFEIPKYYQKASIEDLTQKTLEDLRRTFGESRPYVDGDLVETNDDVTVDMEFFDAETSAKIEDLSKEGMLHTVGSGIKELDEALLGMAPGETKTIPFNFKTPEYPKDMTVKQTVHMGMKKTPLELNDELAKKTKLESLEKLIEQINGMHSSAARQAEEHHLKDQIYARLLENNEVTPPDYLVEAEAMSGFQLTPEQFSALPEEQKVEYKDAATKAVKLSLILDEIRSQEPSCTFSDFEILNILNKKLAASGQDGERIINNLVKSNRIVGAMANIRDSIVIEYISGTCTFVN